MITRTIEMLRNRTPYKKGQVLEVGEGCNLNLSTAEHWCRMRRAKWVDPKPSKAKRVKRKTAIDDDDVGESTADVRSGTDIADGG